MADRYSTLNLNRTLTQFAMENMSAGGSFYLAMALGVGLSHAIWLRRSRVPGERHLL